MSVKSERKKQIRAKKQAAAAQAAQSETQWALPPTPTTTLAAKPFEGFGEHEPDCDCNRKTEKFLDKTLRQLGFLELACPFESGHDVVVPPGLDSRNDAERIAALDTYSALMDRLNEVGLAKNADEVHACIHQYLDHGLGGKIFFHPAMDEVPVGLLTKKQSDAYFSQLDDEAKTKVRAFIPTLPRNAMVTVLTNDPEIKDGVLGSVRIWDNGTITAGFDLSKGETGESYLEAILSRGLFMSQFGTGVDTVVVVKTADDVKYVRLFDQRIFELDTEVGKKFALNFLTYRGKPFAKFIETESWSKLPKSRVMFYIAYIEKNNVLKGGSGKRAAA